MTRVYARDNNSYMFKDVVIKMFINQAIDRIKQYAVFKNMTKLIANADEVKYLPDSYHYILALFAASRCYDTDERFYEGTEKRNEFEFYLDNLIADIETGNIVILDANGVAVTEQNNCIDFVTDVYFTNVLADVLDEGVGTIE